MASTIGKLLVELGLEDSQFRGGIKGATSALEQMQGAGVKFADSLDTAVTGALAAAGAALAAFGVAAVKVGADFEQAITTVGAVAGASDTELAQLTARARELGASTKFTATEAATAMQDFARAGMSVNAILNSSGPALLFAAGAGTDMATATSLTAATLSQFQLDATQAGRVADVFSTALRKSLFDVESLREAMKYAGTVGAGFGYSLEETTAAVAQFRNLGLEGSMAGTNFRMALSAAANVTEDAQRTLAKYGLTAQDINPELHSFAEIMTTVGRVSMTTSDALDVFGQRSGANVAQIARQFGDSTTGYYTLLDQVENSAGQAEVLYNRMTDTVQGRFDIALSAFQELMLSLFDTMKGPLGDLLDELASTIAYVAAVFNRSAGTIGNSFEQMVGQAVKFLRENRAMIATTFVDFVAGLRDAVVLLVRMIPTLDTLAKTMLLVWVADKVRVFTIAVQGGITALTAMGGSIRAVMLALTAATGGIYAVVAAVGTLVAGLIYLVSTTNEAEAAAERLRAAEAALAADQEARAQAQRAAADALAAQQGVRLGQLQLQLQAEGELTSTLDQQLERLQALDTASVQAGLASGNLFVATLGGTEVVLDHATALQLQYDTSTQAADAAAALQQAQGAARGEVATLNRELARYTKAIDTYDTFTQAGGQATVAFKTQIQGLAGSIEEARARAQELAARVDDAREKAEGLAQGATLATQALAKKEIAAHLAAASTGRMADEDEGAGKAAKAGADEAKKAYEARLKAVERVEDAIARRQVQAAQQAALELQNELADLNKVFDAEVAAYGRQTAKVRAAEQERARVVAVVRADAAAQQQQEQQALVQQLDDALAAAGRTAAERERADLQARTTARRAALELEFQQELALYEAGSAERLDVMLRFMQARARLEEVEAAETLARVRETYTAINAEIEQLQLSDAEGRMNELERIELDRLRTLAANSEATEQQIAEINAVYDARVLEQKRKLTEEVVLLTAGQNRKVIELERERDALLARLGEDQLAERQAVVAHYAAAIIAAGEDTAEETSKAAQVMAAAFGAVQRAALAVARAIGVGIASAARGVVDLFGQLTGFAFSLSGAVDAAASGMADAAALQEQLAAGELSPADYEAALAGLPATAAEGAVLYVQELLGGASDLLATFVEAAPAALQALAAELPALVQQFAAALPGLAGTLAQAAGALVAALVAELPTVVQALADSVGVLVQALVEQLPALVQALVAALQAALPALLQAVVALIDLVPVLVDTVLRAVPQLVQALVQVVQALVPALVDAALGLVQVVIAQLPTIVQALTQGALQVVTVLVAEVPRLITGVVQQLPQLVAALLQAVTLLVEELILQLPSIVEALLLAVTDIVVGVVAMLPDLIVAIITMLPQLISAIVRLIPAVIGGVANALPQIVTALIGLVPTLVVAFITELVPAIIKSLPAILYELTVGLVLALGEALATLARGIGEAVVAGLQRLVQFFKDVLTEIFTLGRAETSSFGDTPGAVKAGTDGLSARFAPGDYVIAAQRPADLLRQALDAMGGQLAAGLAPAARGYTPGELEVPAAAGLASAMLQAATAMQGAVAGGAGAAAGQQLQVVVQANGRTLDEALFTAGQRGEAPRLQRELRRTTLRAGVHVGFDRGRF